MEALKRWRLSLPKNQRSLNNAGRLLGVSGTQMYRYEKGKRRVPPEKAARYEGITNIPKAVLRPDVFAAPSKQLT